MSLVLAFLEKWKVQIQLLVISHLRSRAVVKAPWKVSSYRHRRAGEMAQLLKAGSQPKCQMWAVFLCSADSGNLSGKFYPLANMLLLRINSPKEYPSSPGSNGVPYLQRPHCKGDTALKVISSFGMLVLSWSSLAISKEVPRCF